MHSWGWLGEELLEVGKQQIEGRFDVLGNGPDFGANGDEVMIILPAGNEMEVEMIGNPSTGDFPQVQADVDPMGMQVAADDGATAGEQFHQPKLFNFLKIGEIRHVAAGCEQQVPVGVGKAVEQDNGQVVTKQQEMLFVKGGLSRWFEQATCGVRRRPANVLHAPGGPEGFHGSGGIS